MYEFTPPSWATELVAAEDEHNAAIEQLGRAYGLILAAEMRIAAARQAQRTAEGERFDAAIKAVRAVRAPRQ